MASKQGVLCLFSLVIVCCTVVDNVNCSKILMFPFGHFNHPVLKLTEHLSTLLAENHTVSILINEAYKPSMELQRAGVKLVTFERPSTADTEQNLKMSLEDYAEMTLYDFYKLEGETSSDFCKAILKNKDLLKRLQDMNFDLMFIDCVELCGRIIAGHLDVPAITLQWDLSVAKMENLEFSFDLSYFPHDFLPNARDVMTFPQRLTNVIDFVLSAYGMSYFQNKIAQIAYKNKIVKKDIDDLSLIYGNFPFEYPTLTSPDMVFAGDIFIAPPKQLPNDVKQFLASSGKDGVIVVSFSDFIHDYGDRFLTIFSEALSNVPYKVIWHYQGKTRPETVGKNVMLVSNFPRSTYLAHPKVKLFISGSTIGDAYEATHFGVPVIAIPMNMDGYRDATRLTKHFKMGIKMDILQITAITLERAIQEVMAEGEYEKNAEEVKTLVQSQPMDSRDLLDYWVNYMITHEGAGHLIPHGRHMPWYKYYLIDVLIFLKLVVLLIGYGVYRAVKYFRKARQAAQNLNKPAEKTKAE